MPATTGRLLQAILASAPEGTLARLAHRHIRRGEHLVREGTVLDTLYAVETGRFSALRSALKLAEIGVGEAIGEISFLTGDPATADVVALRDSVVLTLDRAVFDEICAQSPAVAQAVAAELATRLAVTNARVAADPTPPLIRTLAVVPVAGQALPDGFAARLAQGLGRHRHTDLLTAEAFRAALGQTAPDSEAAATWLNSREGAADLLVFDCATDDDGFASAAIRQADHVLLIGAQAQCRPPALPKRWPCRCCRPRI